MQAIILAAGMGKRLRHLTHDNTKCMIEVAGKKIIDRMLEELIRLDLQKIVIVTGHGFQQLQNYILKTYVNQNFKFIHNENYESTNNIYSLSLTKEYLASDDSIILESDILFQEGVLKDLINNPFPNIALIAKYEQWMEGTMVQIDDRNNITKLISKENFNITETDSYYKTVNVYKFSKEFSSTKYLPFLDAYILSFGQNQFYEQVLNILVLIEKVQLKCQILRDQKWYEIDDQLDLFNANILFSINDQYEKYTACYGGYWRFKNLIDYCYLVNPYFPNKEFKEELKQMSDKLLTNYPSGSKTNNFLAAHLFNICENYICVANGASELIKIIAPLFDGKIGIIYPTFEEYDKCFINGKIIPYHIKNDNFQYSIEELINFYENKAINTLLLVNPDNPSGNYITETEVKIIINWTTERNINLIIDESFIDFSNYPASSSLNNKLLEENKRLIIIKSISKSYGVPGIRLGVLASSNRILIEKLKKELPIWNINSYAEYFLQNIKRHWENYSMSCRLLIAERNRFMALLQTIQILQVYPSRANFFLCKVLNPYSSKELADELLKRYNILIKDCSDKIGMPDGNWIRIAIKGEKDNNHLVYALLEIDRKKAINSLHNYEIPEVL